MTGISRRSTSGDDHRRSFSHRENRRFRVALSKIPLQSQHSSPLSPETAHVEVEPVVLRPLRPHSATATEAFHETRSPHNHLIYPQPSPALDCFSFPLPYLWIWDIFNWPPSVWSPSRSFQERRREKEETVPSDPTPSRKSDIQEFPPLRLGES